MSKLQIALISFIAGSILFGLTIYFADRNGHQRCVNENKVAASEQAANNSKAAVKIIKKDIERDKKSEKIKIIIKRIKDPSGCATSIVPGKRVNVMLDTFNSEQK